MTKKKKVKTSWEMTIPELEKMSAEFDQELVADAFGPLSQPMRARMERAKRKKGRPRTGAGSRAISVTVEKDLLRRVDQLAKRTKTPRAQLVARGLRAVLSEQSSDRRERSDAQ